MLFLKVLYIFLAVNNNTKQKVLLELRKTFDSWSEFQELRCIFKFVVAVHSYSRDQSKMIIFSRGDYLDINEQN